MNKDVIIGFLAFLVIVGLLLWVFSAISHEILFGVLVGLVPSGILFYQERQKAKMEYRNWLLRNKEACLIELVDTFISGLYDKKSSEEKKAEKIMKKLQMIQSSLLIWGSPSLIGAWNELQTSIGTSKSDEETMRHSEKFFRVIRKELDHDDSDLAPGEIWATILKSDEKQKVLDACKGEIYETGDYGKKQGK